MPETSSERRLAENEVVFRTLNEQVHSGFEETNRLASEDNQPEFFVTHDKSDVPLLFYCECSDEKCAKRISITVHEYQRIHKHRDRFIIVPGHEVALIEKVVKKGKSYDVVQKHMTPPESANMLHPTSIRNE